MTSPSRNPLSRREGGHGNRYRVALAGDGEAPEPTLFSPDTATVTINESDPIGGGSAVGLGSLFVLLSLLCLPAVVRRWFV